MSSYIRRIKDRNRGCITSYPHKVRLRFVQLDRMIVDVLCTNEVLSVADASKSVRIGHIARLYGNEVEDLTISYNFGINLQAYKQLQSSVHRKCLHEVHSLVDEAIEAFDEEAQLPGTPIVRWWKSRHTTPQEELRPGIGRISIELVGSLLLSVILFLRHWCGNLSNLITIYRTPTTTCPQP